MANNNCQFQSGNANDDFCMQNYNYNINKTMMQ